MYQKERFILALLCAAFLVTLAGCSPPFPKELLEQVEKDAPFAVLHRDPERFIGKLMLLGGAIVDTRVLKEGTRIEVLQLPLDGEGRPELTDETGGRFLIMTQQVLDSAIYHRGRSITVIGVVAAPQVLTLEEIEYRYPVLEARGLHLWPPYTGPRFSIGIGVYRGF